MHSVLLRERAWYRREGVEILTLLALLVTTKMQALYTCHCACVLAMWEMHKACTGPTDLFCDTQPMLDTLLPFKHFLNRSSTAQETSLPA